MSQKKNYGQPSRRKTAATEVVSALLQSEGCERAPHVLTPMHAKYVAANTKRLNVHNHKRARDTRNLHTSKVGQTRVLLYTAVEFDLESLKTYQYNLFMH